MQLIWSAICLGTLAVVLACGEPESAPDAVADAPSRSEPVTEPEPAAEPQPESKPAKAASAEPGDPTAGAEQYRMYCATCHGETGCGDGPLSAGLDPKPAKHCDGNYMNALNDAYLFKVVKEGGVAVGKSPLMAPWGGSLSDTQIRDVIAYIRSIAEPPYSAPGR